MSITIEIKSVYGKELIYPVSVSAFVFTDLTGKKTLSRKDLDSIKSLGYEIKVLSVKL